MSEGLKIFCANVVKNAQFSYGSKNAERHLAMQRFVREKNDGRYLPRYPMLSGCEIPEEMKPKQITLKRITRRPDNATGYWTNIGKKDPYDSYEMFNTLGDVTSSMFGWIVSKKARLLIEEIQPKQHVFSGLTITKVNGEKVRRDYYTLNLCNDWALIESTLAGSGYSDLAALESCVWALEGRVFCPWRFLEQFQSVGVDTYRNTFPMKISEVLAGRRIDLEP